MVEIMVDDSGHAVQVEGRDKLPAIRRLLALAEYENSIDAEEVLTQAEEANAMGPSGERRLRVGRGDRTFGWANGEHR